MLYGFFITPPEATNTDPGFNRGSGAAAPGSVTSKNGRGHMRVQRGSFPIAHDVCVCVCLSPLKRLLSSRINNAAGPRVAPGVT